LLVDNKKKKKNPTFFGQIIVIEGDEFKNQEKRQFDVSEQLLLGGKKGRETRGPNLGVVTITHHK